MEREEIKKHILCILDGVGDLLNAGKALLDLSILLRRQNPQLSASLAKLGGKVIEDAGVILKSWMALSGVDIGELEVGGREEGG